MVCVIPGLILGLRPAKQSNAVSHWLGAILDSALNTLTAVTQSRPIVLNCSHCKVFFVITMALLTRLLVIAAHRSWYCRSLLFRIRSCLRLAWPLDNRIYVVLLQYRKHYIDQCDSCFYTTTAWNITVLDQQKRSKYHRARLPFTRKLWNVWSKTYILICDITIRVNKRNI